MALGLQFICDDCGIVWDTTWYESDELSDDALRSVDLVKLHQEALCFDGAEFYCVECWTKHHPNEEPQLVEAE